MFCLHVHLYTTFMQCPQRLEEDDMSPRTIVTGGCEHHVCAENGTLTCLKLLAFK